MYSFEDLVRITAQLRSEHGCPWDRKQTHESLKPCLKEESEEVFAAIDNHDMENLCEELPGADAQPDRRGKRCVYDG